MDLAAVMLQLEQVAKQTHRLDALAVRGALDLLALPRYAGDQGGERLATDIREVIQNLPETSIRKQPALTLREGAEVLFMTDSGGDPLSDRLTRLAGDKSVARKWCRWYVLSLVAHQLLELWRSAPEGDEAMDTFERLAYWYRWEIDEDDPRKQLVHRDIHVRVAAPAQMYAGILHAYLVPAEADVEALEDGQAYVGTVKAKESWSDKWWQKHVLDLGRLLDINELVWLRTRERYCDAKRQLYDVNPVFGLHMRVGVTSRHELVNLAVRLPTVLRSSARVEARISDLQYPLRRPGSAEISLDDDGWARHEFPRVAPGCECGLFITGPRIYD